MGEDRLRDHPEILLLNYNLADPVCGVNPKLGTVCEQSRGGLGPEAFTLGLYVNTSQYEVSQPRYEAHGGRLIGVFAGPNGPVFFIGQRFVPLSVGSCASQLELGEKLNRFTLTVDNRCVLLLSYPRRYDDGDPWANEVDLDFFRWLHGVIESGVLFDTYREP